MSWARCDISEVKSGLLTILALNSISLWEESNFLLSWVLALDYVLEFTESTLWMLWSSIANSLVWLREFLRPAEESITDSFKLDLEGDASSEPPLSHNRSNAARKRDSTSSPSSSIIFITSSKTSCFWESSTRVFISFYFSWSILARTILWFRIEI